MNSKIVKTLRRNIGYGDKMRSAWKRKQLRIKKENRIELIKRFKLKGER